MKLSVRFLLGSAASSATSYAHGLYAAHAATTGAKHFAAWAHDVQCASGMTGLGLFACALFALAHEIDQAEKRRPR